LPEHVKTLLKEGTQGIQSYLGILSVIDQRHEALVSTGLQKQLRSFETRIEKNQIQLETAEGKTEKLLTALNY